MNLEGIHSECHKIYKQEFYSFTDWGDGEDDQSKFYGPTNACKIFDKLTEGTESSENCIGENLNQLVQNINDEWFLNYSPGSNLSFYFMNYLLLLYLFVERIDLIFDVINKDGKSKLFNDYHFQNFKTLRKINKWANFIKHPKEFMFTHWPKYYMEGQNENVLIAETDIKIDTDFIFKHYFSEKQERPYMLENNQKVFVEVPNMIELTKGFCQEMNLFFDFICANQVVADYLGKKSTIVNYYQSEEDIEPIQEDRDKTD